MMYKKDQGEGKQTCGNGNGGWGGAVMTKNQGPTITGI